jgi:hypothetical protein
MEPFKRVDLTQNQRTGFRIMIPVTKKTFALGFENGFLIFREAELRGLGLRSRKIN